MGRTAQPVTADLSALTGEPEVVEGSTAEIPADVVAFIAHAIAEADEHENYLHLSVPPEAADVAFRLGRIQAGRMGYKLLTRGYVPKETKELIYRVKAR